MGISIGLGTPLYNNIIDKSAVNGADLSTSRLHMLTVVAFCAGAQQA
ncbi:hypothetical protein LJR034_005713 [Caballeronia sp. LjRoot34]